jgi:hypothetical protein
MYHVAAGLLDKEGGGVIQEARFFWTGTHTTPELDASAFQ